MNDDCIITDRPDLRIVSDQIWLAVQPKSTEPSALLGTARPTYLLSKKFSCPFCGGSMVSRKQSTRQEYVWICTEKRDHNNCVFNRPINNIALERIVVGEGLQTLLVDKAAEYKAAVREAFEEFVKRVPETRERIGQEIKEIEDDIRILSRTVSKSRIGQESNQEALDEKERQLIDKQVQMAKTPATLILPENDHRVEALAGALDKLFLAAPFRPKNEEEFEVFEVLRRAIVSVNLEVIEGDRMNINATYDVGALFGVNAERLETLTFSDRVITNFAAIKRAAREMLEQSKKSGRFTITDEEWEDRPKVARPVAFERLQCNGRSLVNAMLLSAEANCPLKYCMTAWGCIGEHYEMPLEKIRMSDDFEAFLNWLAEIRPHIEDWSKLELKKSRLAPFADRFNAHPLKLLGRIDDPSTPPAISSDEWEDLLPKLKRIKGFSDDRSLRFANLMLAMIRARCSVKAGANGTKPAAKFSWWLKLFERSGNLEAMTRYLAAKEGMPVPDGKFPLLISGSTGKAKSAAASSSKR